MKEKLIFATEVVLIVSALAYFNSKVWPIPVIGSWLPGGDKF